MSKATKNRKKDHLKFALSPDVQVGSTGLEKYRFVHNALPQVDYDEIDTSVFFLSKRLNYPFFISCMTGGIKKGMVLNENLAKAAQKHGIAMGVGSQRMAIEDPSLVGFFQVRKFAPDVLLFANVGLVQLNYGFGIREMRRCVEMIEADALVVHLNPIQEVIQPEGDRNFDGLLQKLEKVVKELDVPVIAKEVGFGLSYDVAKRLYSVGVKIYDSAGWGGTNWALVEGMRGKADKNLSILFSDWGIPTADSVIDLVRLRKDMGDGEISVIGSGGIRTGIDIAKVIGLGADLAGIAAPFAKAALLSYDKVEELIIRLSKELKTCMFAVGARTISDLRNAPLIDQATGEIVAGK
jgi:isopentenyl-diphosphate delta-isomerase